MGLVLIPLTAILTPASLCALELSALGEAFPAGRCKSSDHGTRSRTWRTCPFNTCRDAHSTADDVSNSTVAATGNRRALKRPNENEFMKTQIETEIQSLINKATYSTGDDRLEHLNHAAALAESAETPKTIVLSNMTKDREATVRTLQEALKWPEVRNNAIASATSREPSGISGSVCQKTSFLFLLFPLFGLDWEPSKEKRAKLFIYRVFAR